MKICLIGPGIMPIPPAGWGAVESLMWEYYRVLTKLGHLVDIINEPDRQKIIQLENSIEYDVTHVHYDVFYDILPQLKARKVLISSHYPYVDQIEKHCQDDYGKIFRYMIDNAHKYKIAAISAKDANCYTSHGVNPADIFVIPNGVNVDNFAFEPNEYTLGRFLTVCLAKIEPRKRQFLTKNFPTVAYIGKGPMNHEAYAGEITQEEKYKNLHKFGNMILLSTGENGTPLALKEGMAAGLSLVVSEFASSEIANLPFVDVIPESKIGDEGYLVEVLIRNLSRNNPEQRKIIRQYCKEHWSWDVLVAEYAKHLEGLLQ